MGIYTGIRSHCRCRTEVPVNHGNPNPYDFEVLQCLIIGKYTLCVLRYPDCTNYEGKKILLYDGGFTPGEQTQKLDPHFCDQPGCISPIARFEPTKEGWENGKMLAEILNKRDRSNDSVTIRIEQDSATGETLIFAK